MKKLLWRSTLMLTFLLCLFAVFCLSSFAENYEPDGTSSVITACETEDWNRTIYVRMEDEDGNHLKTVEIRTSRGKDTFELICIYNYNIVSFTSDQGLWETCQLGWESGGDFYGSDIWIKYYFRTGMSKDVLNVTVVLRPFPTLEIKEMHYLEVREGNNGSIRGNLLGECSETTLYCGDHFSSHAIDYTGYTLNENYEASFSGNWSMSWVNQSENLDSMYMDWDMVEMHPDLKDQHIDFSDYSESENGHLSYAKNRKLKLLYVYEVDWCVYTFDANGGDGAPDNLEWWYDHDVVIPEDVPTRPGYTFLGWGEDPDKTEIFCTPSEETKIGLTKTLYAIWEQNDYEFSISNLSVTPQSPSGELIANSKATVTVRTDSWDRNDAYEDIPVSLYYDGTLLFTQKIDFAVYGAAYVTFEVDLGAKSGTHEIEVRINWTDRGKEVDPDNNAIKETVYIKADDYGFSISVITGNAQYKEGTDVITSFLVSNTSERAVLPDAHASATFKLYAFDDNDKFLIMEQTQTDIVIPVGESNLIYLKWRVPDGVAGEKMICECTVNPSGALKEENRNDNTASLSTVIAPKDTSQTPDPGYAESAPDGFVKENVPDTNAGSASWSVWVYENGQFVQNRYGIKVADTVPVLSPGNTCETAVFANGTWTMRSGYGIRLYYTPTVETLNECLTPTEGMVTSIQSASVTLPEYGYSAEDGEHRALALVNGAWQFVENLSADGNERVHYIPVWFEDGSYTLAVTVSDIWTPAGLVRATKCATVIIDGSIFNDFYVGS